MRKHLQDHTTLDNKHTEMLNKFKNNEENLIPKYKSEIEKLEKTLNNIKVLKENKEKKEKKEKTEQDISNKILLLKKKNL